MAVVLDMVRRYGRVPVGLIYDGGAEFGSTDFNDLLSFLSIDGKPRIASACRHGSVIERMFGVTQGAFVSQLQGNTKAYERFLAMTREINPIERAIFTLPILYEALDEFFDAYNERRHGTLLVSPRYMFDRGLDQSGQRLNRIKRIEDCIPHAFPTVRGRTRVIDAQRGVEINYKHYRNPHLEHAQYHGLKVHVKWDPLRKNVVYVFVGHRWVPMYCGDVVERSAFDDFFAFAHSEEELILQELTRTSQAEANQKFAAVVDELQERATQERIYSEEEDEESEPADEDVAGEGVGSGKNGEDSDRSIQDAMEELKREGFHGETY